MTSSCLSFPVRAVHRGQLFGFSRFGWDIKRWRGVRGVTGRLGGGLVYVFVFGREGLGCGLRMVSGRRAARAEERGGVSEEASNQ